MVDQGLETLPGYYPCHLEWDVTMSASSTYCSGCDFVMDGTFTYNSSASSIGADYCGTGMTFNATVAHHSSYLGWYSAALYDYGGIWYILDYAAFYSGGSWQWSGGYRDYYYIDWTTFYGYYYTNYAEMTAYLF